MTTLAIFGTLYAFGVAGLLLVSPWVARDLRVPASEIRTAVLHAGVAFPLVLVAVWSMLLLVTA